MVSITNFNNRLVLGGTTNKAKPILQEKDKLTLRNDVQLDGFVKTENNSPKALAHLVYKNKKGDTLVFMEPADKSPDTKVVIQVVDRNGNQVIRTETWKEVQQRIKNGHYKLEQ